MSRIRGGVPWVLCPSLYSGGWNSQSGHFSDVLRYEPTSQQWTKTGDMTIPRHSHGVSTVTWDTVAPLCIPYVPPPACVSSTCEAGNCLTYPADHPCSDYHNNAEEVTYHLITWFVSDKLVAGVDTAVREWRQHNADIWKFWCRIWLQLSFGLGGGGIRRIQWEVVWRREWRLSSRALHKLWGEQYGGQVPQQLGDNWDWVQSSVGRTNNSYTLPCWWQYSVPCRCMEHRLP